MELTVPTVVRWYRYWQKKGGYRYGKENFCHFVRTVLFYAPVRWFFFARTARIVAPWSVTLLLTLLALWPLKTTIGIGALLLLVAIGWLLKSKMHNIGEFLVDLADSLDCWFGPIVQFMRLNVIGRLEAWLFVSAITVGLGLVFLPDFAFPILLLAFAVALYIGIVVGSIIGLIRVLEYSEARRRRRNTTRPEKYRQTKIGEFFKVIREYLRAFDKKLCPFVEVKKNSIVFYWE